MAAGGVSPKVGKIVDLPANAPTIGTVTDLANGGGVTVAYTAGDTSVGGPIVNYTATSTPGSISANGTSSPITVSGLTVGTSYTFTVKSNNASGSSPLSGSSSAVTPTVPPTSFYNIATATAAGGETSLTFSSIPGTYKSLQIRGTGLITNSLFLINYNGDTTIANYGYFHGLNGDGTSTNAFAINSTAPRIGVTTGSGSYQGAFIFDLIDYASTTKNKTHRSFYGIEYNGTSTGSVGLYSGEWLSTSAVTSITIKGNSSGTFSAGATFALYGVN